MRALLGRMGQHLADGGAAAEGRARSMSIRMRTRKESRKVVEELLAMME